MWNLLTSLMLLVAPARDPLAAPLDSLLQAQARAGFSGAVLIACGDSVRFERAYGGAAAIAGAPERVAFWIASDSKQFTATAVMKLQDLGRLRVTDSIGRFFANAPADKRGITIDQLLTHTSGLPTAYAAEGVADRERAVEKILALKLDSRPGEKFSYSNDGYTLLAAIVDLASGVGFDSFLRDSLFVPAGLARTGLWGFEDPATPIAPLANPERAKKQRSEIFKDGHSVANWGYRGPGGAWSTTRDLHRWVQALQSGRVISDSAWRQMIGRHVLVRAGKENQSYTGYGWGIRVAGGKDVFYSHAGYDDWLGHSSIVHFTPAGEILIVLSNSGEIEGAPWAERVSRAVRTLLEKTAPCEP